MASAKCKYGTSCVISHSFIFVSYYTTISEDVTNPKIPRPAALKERPDMSRNQAMVGGFVFCAFTIVALVAIIAFGYVIVQLANFTNPRMHQFLIPQCSIPTINVHISVLNSALWVMEQEHFGIHELGQFPTESLLSPSGHMLYLY